MLRTDHNFAHVTTAQLSWHVQICELKRLQNHNYNNKIFKISIMSSQIFGEMCPWSVQGQTSNDLPPGNSNK